jgi:AcrR family transcriptional regulator
MRKGQETRALVLDHALALVSRVGFEGLTIGNLANSVGLSKSGLFGHFRSKERLQIEVLETAVERFMKTVIHPALKTPRGEPRVRAFFKNWLAWGRGHVSQSGGCVFIAAANELDDRESGPLRDRLVDYQREWLHGLARAAQLAVEEGHFRADLDTDQFAYEFYSIILSFHHSSRLLRDSRSDERAERQFERLIGNSKPVDSKTAEGMKPSEPMGSEPRLVDA